MPITDILGQLLNTGASWALNQYSGLSKSERQQNEFNANQAQIGRDFSAQQAEVERDWQEEMYSKYNSLQGQINQAKEAGVNPMFAVTGSATSPMSASAGTAAAPTASGSASRGPNIDMVGAALGFSKLKAELDNINAQTEKIRIESKRQEILSAYDGELTETRIAEMQQNIKSNAQSVNESLERTKTYSQNISESNKRIEVMGKEIELMGSDIALKVTQSALNRLNAQSVELMLPYIQARQEAEIAYTTAATEVAKFAAERQMYDANVSMLNGMKEAKLIDEGYYDNLIESSKWDSKGKKRTYKWSPINDVCTNLSRVAIGVGSVLGGGASVLGALPTAAAAPIGFGK